MVNRHRHFFILMLCVLSVSASCQKPGAPNDGSKTSPTAPLTSRLSQLLAKGIMFGHQDDLAYGYNWKYVPGNSDVKLVTGDYPAVIGWELGHLELGAAVSLDSVPFSFMKEKIIWSSKMGLITTLSWHPDNPLTGKSAWDAAPGTVRSVLPGGGKYALYTHWLDRLSDFFLSLKDEQGQPIPVMFRPYHELTGSWFWWGESLCSQDEFRQLWTMTVNYLKKRGVNNLLYVYSTAEFRSVEHFLQRYPGDELVDLIGFDSYQRNDPAVDSSFFKSMKRQLNELCSIARTHGKIPALTETGYEAVPSANWWTGTLWPLISDLPISYVLVWRNAGLLPSGKYHYYTPYQGDVSERDFVDYYNLPNTLFGKDVSY